jgi:hypothetical protein
LCWLGMLEVIFRKPRRLLALGFEMVRPAGRTHLEVEVLYSPGKGKS